MSVALVLDFDNTLTVTRAVDNYSLEKLFGGHERLLRIVRFIRAMHYDGVSLYICSGNKEKRIIGILDRIGAEGYHLKTSWFRKIQGGIPEDKFEFVNALAGYDKIVFVDDYPQALENVDRSRVTTILVNQSGGMTGDDELRVRVAIQGAKADESAFITPPRKKHISF